MSRLLAAQRALTLPGWIKEDLSRKAQAIPSLDLRFAEGKSLVDATTGANLVTFTRASSGTFVGSDGVLRTATNDAPRFDHNPTTGESLGLLIEEQRTNLLVRSEEFNDASWTKTGLLAFGSGSVVNSTGTLAPDGTSTADLLVEDTSTGAHQLQQGAPVSGTTYSYSLYAKQAGRTKLTITGGGFTGQGFTLIFNLSTGTLVQNGGGKGAIASVGNGWYRCSVSFTASNTVGFSLVFVNDSLSTSYTGNGTSGIYIWGAQLEAGAFATSYIPTTTAAATRSADVASITGTNFSSWYRQDEGTVFAETQLQSIAARNAAGFDINDNSTNNRIVFRTLTSSVADQVVIRSASSTVFTAANVLPAPTTTLRKSAVGYKVNDFMFTAIGNAGYTGTTGASPVSVSQMLIGYEQGPLGYMGGTIRRLTYWPVRLGNNVLQQITQ